jgi:hypothetical protein
MWGSRTQRSLIHFSIRNDGMPIELSSPGDKTQVKAGEQHFVWVESEAGLKTWSC